MCCIESLFVILSAIGYRLLAINYSAMDDELGTLQSEALAEIAHAQNVIELDQVRVKYLGRSGLISKLSESMRSLPKEDRPRVGKLLNEVGSALDRAFADKSEAFAAQQDLVALDD